MSNGWKTLIIVVSILFVGAAFLNERLINRLRNDYQAVVEENKALKAEILKEKESHSPKSDFYPELTARAMIRLEDDREIYIPLFSVKFGTFSPGEDQFGYTPKGTKGLAKVWEKQQFYPAIGQKTRVSRETLPGPLKYLKDELKSVSYIAADGKGNYWVFFKGDENFEIAFKFYQVLTALYPDPYPLLRY